MKPGKEMELNETFKQAVAHHQVGRFAEAEELYRRVLQVDRRHLDANHNLGLMAMQLGQAQKGLPYLQTAWEAEPSVDQYWLTLTECLLEMGHYEDALLLIEDAIKRGIQSPQAQQLRQRAKNGRGNKRQPADTVVEEILALFRSARFAEVEEKTKLLVEIYPNWAWGWKLLGATMQNQGKDGVKVMRRAVELNPNDAEVHNNLGVMLQSQGQIEAALKSLRRALELKPDYANAHNSLGSILDDLEQFDAAQSSYRRAIKINPDLADAHNNLGSSLKEQGLFDAAAASLRRAIAIKPDYAEAHNNLGIVLMDQGKLDEALASCRRALELNPNSPEVHYSLGCVLNELGQPDAAQASYCRTLELNPGYAQAHSSLGITLLALGRLNEAEASCQRALQIKPDLADAHNNLGNILKDMGRLDEAEASYRRALQVKPDAEILCNLGHTLYDLDDLGQAAVIYQKALDLKPANSGLDAAINLAILHYLEGNFEQCRSKLHASLPIMGKFDLKYKNIHVYWRYLDKLLFWQQQQSNQKNLQTQGIKLLHVIGESHSLAAHGTVVCYKKEEMRCVAELIFGCKQWHLGNGKPNKYKHKFEAVMARLPREAAILLSIGEIDCRYDEGIIKAGEKYPDKTLAEIMQSTIDAYLGYVAAIAARYGHRIIVAGVPATNIPLESLDQSAAGKLIQLIRIFNASLKSQSLAAGMDFLDVYALTDRGDGIASGEWHIDEIHLLPSAVVEAFGRHCTLHQ
ncbi:MAG: tetratricopeptide repeat protein [Gallionella sp.]|nr:tetratricopeptide repeat protein [Gallionella sp.]